MHQRDRDQQLNDLRRRAEAVLAKDASTPKQREEAAELFHELQVHQIELELQNEELRRIQRELEQSRRQYINLYDLAPIAYCTIDQEGSILRANLAAATLFAVDRNQLIGQPFSRFIPQEYQTRFYFHKKHLLETRDAQVIELELRNCNRSRFWARLQSAFAAPSEFRIMILDITARRRFEAAEHEQRMLSEALRDTALALNSTLKLDEVFDRILSNVRRVVPHDAAAIFLIEEDDARIVRHSGYMPEEANAFETATFRIEDYPPLERMYRNGNPLLIVDTADEIYQNLTEQSARLHALAGVPLYFRDKVAGALVLRSCTPGFFSSRHLEKLQAFADHAAIALENARLHEKARDLAVMEERQRLARNLHDAVSQTLFSANMLSEALINNWRQQPEKVEGYLNRLYKLTRGAMAQMRTLLLELRPGTLSEAAIEELLQQLVEAAEGRTEIKVFLELDCTTALPDSLHEAVYYVAQEALNNVVKHSRATESSIRLYYHPDEMRLVVHDNGCGFDINERRSTALGLDIMQERAVALDGTLTIQSELGQGTQIIFEWCET